MTFDVARFRALALGRCRELGTPLVAMEATGSTNDDAMAAARGGARHGATFVAEHQTAGRGRRGARWSSLGGRNLTFSIVLRLDLPAERLTALPLLIGLAVREAAERRVSVPVELKWPNDVLAREKKLAGILVESQIVQRQVEAVVVGVGINVGARELPAELSQIATSLALLGAEAPAREELLVDILQSIEARLAGFRQAGISSAMSELRAHDALRGRPVRIDGVVGIARGIAEDGALLVEQSDGNLERVVSGLVELAD